MKILKNQFLSSLGVCALMALAASSVQAEVTVLFDGEQTPFDNTPGGAFANFANVTGNTGFDPGGNSALATDYGITLVDAASNPFGTGNAARIFDFAPDEKPEVQGEVGFFDGTTGEFVSTPLLEPFRIDIQSFNQSANSSTRAIRFRMANSGQSITSESRTAFSISFQADGDTNAKYSGIADTNGVDADGNPILDSNRNDVDTISTDPIEGVSTMTMVANGSTTDTFTYTLFGLTRTLDPLHYDVYISGELLNTSTDDPVTDLDFARVEDRANGLQFTTENSFGQYLPNNGLGRFGLVGSSDSNVDPDYIFDNIVLRTGADIEEDTSGGVVGDFNGDGVVNCDDLDGFVGNIGEAAAGDLAALDFDGDGTLSATDATSIITTLVETSNGQVGTFAGDLNCDGTVDVLGDAFALIGSLNTDVTSYADGDINFDGSVDVLGDAFLLIGNLGQTNAPSF